MECAVLVDKKLLKKVQQKRAGLEIFEAISRSLKTIEDLSKDSFTKNERKINWEVQELKRYWDRLFTYMMCKKRKDDKR